MQIYLVGGAVRDQLLGLPINEKDWVVVGATVAEMLKKGFKQVGKDFPVFLHPKTGEEYALARVERKIGLGYTGFSFDASLSVTLEQDLQRRDLTINAIAKSADGRFIDPYQGQEDLKKKILRHVSPAFSEDPVRILRTARFLARFAQYGFTVASDTMALMKEMVAAGEVNALVAERVWKEVERTLVEKNPELFFTTLAECGALAILFPALQDKEWNALIQTSQLTSDKQVRFAALLHDVTIEQIENLCESYRVPSEYHDLAIIVAKQFSLYQRTLELSAEQIVQLLLAVDAFRREERFKKWLLACEAISPISYSDQLLACYNAAKTVDTKTLLAANLSGKEFGEKINQERIALVASLRERGA